MTRICRVVDGDADGTDTGGTDRESLGRNRHRGYGPRVARTWVSSTRKVSVKVLSSAHPKRSRHRSSPSVCTRSAGALPLGLDLRPEPSPVTTRRGERGGDLRRSQVQRFTGSQNALGSTRPVV